MKKEISILRFYFCMFYLLNCCSVDGQTLSAQVFLKPPIKIKAGNPHVIQTPVTSQSSYIIETDKGIRLSIKPPKVFSPPIGTFFKDKKKAEESENLIGRGFFKTYITDDGLPLDAIISSCLDHFGNIWFGTQGAGVTKYDGKSFITYTTAQGLAGNNVWSVMEDRSGNMWFCTNEGVSKYGGKAFISYTSAHGLGNSNVWSIAEDLAGNIWFGTTGGGVSKFNGKSFVNYTVDQGLCNNTVKSILEDKAGNIWLGTNNGVSKYDGKSFVSHTTVQGLTNNYVYCIAEDKMGNIWFGTNGGGVSKYNGKSFVNYTTSDGLASNVVKSIMVDRIGNVWLGTDGGGVSKYDGKSILNYTTAQGLANNYVYSITEDETGNIWFSTSGGGISKYEGKSFVNYTKDQGMAHSNVWSIAEDKKGNLWVGTNGGVSRFDGNNFTNYISDQIDNFTLCIMEDKAKNIWFGTYSEGVYRYDGNNFTNYNIAQGLPNSTVRSMIQDKKGNMWFGTDEGVSCYDGKSFTNYTSDQGLVSNSIYNILEDKAGDLWFSTNEGVSNFDGHYFTNYTTAQGLVNNLVHCTLEDEAGNLWFGTQQGVSYLAFNQRNRESKKKNDPVSFNTITTDNGLPDDFITQIIESGDGKIVVGTNLGIAVFDQPDFKEKRLKGLELFNSSMGYPVKDVNAGYRSIYKDSKGLIWIATGSDNTGLVRFDYAAVHRNHKPPKVLIQSIKIDEESVCWENILKKDRSGKEKIHSSVVNSLRIPYDSLCLLMSEFNAFGRGVQQNVLDDEFKRFGDIEFDNITKFYPLPINLTLPYKHNQISFEFVAIEPSRSSLVKYRYILEGYSKEWSPITKSTNISFGNIDEGVYTFRLKALSPFGVWSQPVTYTFTVLPPWWRTWWAYSFYIVVGISCVFLITRWNGKRLRLKAKELAREVQKATATILEQKKIVEQQKDVVEQQKLVVEHQKHIVEEKNKNITESIDYAQRIQSAILPERDYIKSLFDDYFVYYQPKEIVSGDFYWFGQKNDKIIFAAIDCTGHGVPGALMSMIGNSLMNEIINGKGIVEPDAILNQLREDIIYALKQKDAPESQKDGMDIALCVLDKNKNHLTFSGAHNSLYHIRNNIFTELKGDMQAIGYEKRDRQTFLKSSIEIQKGDMLYLFTDGFADQKGGTAKKKFYYKPFRELLLSIHDKPALEQEKILCDTFNLWKGDIEQIDDVLVIGIRL